MKAPPTWRFVRLLVENGYSGAWSVESHLSLRPHDGGLLGADAAETFVRAGQAMQDLGPAVRSAR
ncbi:hypothetical protein [Amycolatopsis panacis]|uniref:Xylose isomerase-like TIM barrel domain-containing protein n=1 Tax=Amycolatopsis panacis TaxID=2340917 RepID=A0A419HMV5_9PSEU|nr:hypothetical protein [Amycolatopsis panacis]RJQ77455.1 hypothetical protein D5S19_28940 [Amycolatopsis panacis]